jgi:hypothetical protein
METHYVKPKQASLLLHVSLSTVYRWVHKGKLNCDLTTGRLMVQVQRSSTDAVSDALTMPIQAAPPTGIAQTVDRPSIDALTDAPAANPVQVAQATSIAPLEGLRQRDLFVGSGRQAYFVAYQPIPRR